MHDVCLGVSGTPVKHPKGDPGFTGQAGSYAAHGFFSCRGCEAPVGERSEPVPIFFFLLAHS